MAVYEQGSGLPVVFCHGFPELAFSWRFQLPALAAAGFRAIAPDQRGYGGTDKPEAVEDYDIRHLTDDLIGLLDALGLEKAVFCGHDWGGHVVWEMPILHPDRVAGLIAINTPHRYFRRMGADPVTWLLEHFSARNYRLAFLQEGIENGLTPDFSGHAPFQWPNTLLHHRRSATLNSNSSWKLPSIQSRRAGLS